MPPSRRASPSGPACRRSSERAIELRRAQLVKKRRSIDMCCTMPSCRPSCTADGLGSSAASAFQPRRRSSERLVPADRAEVALRLLPDSPERMLQAVRRVGALEIVRDLGAQRCVGEGHRGIALDAGSDAVLHVTSMAQVRTVVRAGHRTTRSGEPSRAFMELFRPPGFHRVARPNGARAHRCRLQMREAADVRRGDDLRPSPPAGRASLRPRSSAESAG